MPNKPPVFRSPVMERMKKQQEKERQTKNSKIYDKDWVKLRKAHLISSPFCVPCSQDFGKLTEASSVHHIVYVRDDDKRRLDPTNCMSICRSCHSRLHAIEDGLFGNRKH